VASVPLHGTHDDEAAGEKKQHITLLSTGSKILIQKLMCQLLKRPSDKVAHDLNRDRQLNFDLKAYAPAA
jgi:hypothetical protein